MEMMTSGVSEILLVSKRSALYEAHALLNQPENALAEINSKLVRNKPFI